MRLSAAPGCLVLALVLALGQLQPSEAGLPLLPPPFIDNYEFAPDGYFNDLFTQLLPPQSYVATLAMVYLVVVGTLGYLPLNLKDVANIIDRKFSGSRRRKRYGKHALGRRRGWTARHGRRGRRETADPSTWEQLLTDIDSENCLLRMVCEIEFIGLREAASVEETVIYKLFSGATQRDGLGAMGRAASLGRTARGQKSRSPCGGVGPRCRLGPLVASRRHDGDRESSKSLKYLDSNSPLTG